jgi:hypothetical protein
VRITDKKKENWINRLDDLKSKVNSLYSEIVDCDVSDEQIDYLANMTCCFDEAMSEVENL